MLKKVLHTIGIVSAIFAMAWIIVGSTVQLHQKSQYHNLLTQWQDMILKTSSKDSKKYFKCFEKNSYSSGNSSFAANDDRNPGLYNFNYSLKNITSGYLCQIQVPEYIKNKPHRGPPAI